MNSLKAEEVSLVSYGHLIFDAKLHVDSLGVLVSLMFAASVICCSVWIEDVHSHFTVVIQAADMALLQWNFGLLFKNKR